MSFIVRKTLAVFGFFLGLFILGMVWPGGPFGARLALAETGCSGDAPLLDAALEVPPASCGTMAGTWAWRLPLSPDRPDVLTHAFVKLRFEKKQADSNWTAFVAFAFDDPKPYGIPFTFQRAKVFWGNATQAPESPAPAKEQFADLDWSYGCEVVGRSLFPGGYWEEEVELPGTADLCTLPSPRLRLWGARY